MIGVTFRPFPENMSKSLLVVLLLHTFNRVPSHSGKSGKSGKIKITFSRQGKLREFEKKTETQGKLREFDGSSG